MEKRWNILKADSATVAALQEQLKISPILCELLVQRGIVDFDAAKKFFRPQIEHLHSPWLMKDMKKAVERIQTAFDKEEKILVYGDYDVDGTTSVATLFQFLKELSPNIDYYIPHRYKEGYGISKIGIDFAKEHGFDLIISVDCGIKSTELISYAKELGMDFVICDHHLPDPVIPPAVAILNPKQLDCTYPFKELCGCGVVFKLITALAETYQLPSESYLQYLDLVMTAIAADIVPVVDENRTLSFFGLQKINENPCNGLKAILEQSKQNLPIKMSSLVFTVSPRINAAGRMDDAKKAVQLFIEKDLTNARAIASLLQQDNLDRREADSTITEEALAQIENDPNHTQKKSSVVFQAHWHKGVVGIVASRLIEKHYKPTIVLTQSGEVIAGSARSVQGFNLYEALHACRAYLLGYGGHFAAAGMTLALDQLEAFKEAFEQSVAERITEEQLTPEITINSVLPLDNINMNFYQIISQMEPFGPDNMKPIFIAHKVQDTGYSKIVKDQHISCSFKQAKNTLRGIGYNMQQHMNVIESGKPFDIVFQLQLNDWQGTQSVQLQIIDIKPCEA
ncbi:MAG: single-stranded-DNA-specific exonuclease RecJ [Chitinophagaceae bacterium]|jgi:single-stranded-DNA-specific exonuclease|nr:single-stranded-DNA-specific exonuclease RecJ [Sediminibacterium sp.]